MQAATDIDDVIGTNQKSNKESYKEPYQGEIVDNENNLLYRRQLKRMLWIGTNQKSYKESYKGEFIDSASIFYIVQAATDIDDVIGTNQESYKKSYKKSNKGKIIDGASIILLCTQQLILMM
jgi:hypothetical protein